MKVIEAINKQYEHILEEQMIKMYVHLKEQTIEPELVDHKNIAACDPYIKPTTPIDLLTQAYKKRLEKRFEGDPYLKPCKAGVFNSLKNNLYCEQPIES